MRERSLSLTPLNEEPASPSRMSTHQHTYPANLTPDHSIVDSDSDDDDAAANDKFKKPRGRWREYCPHLIKSLTKCRYKNLIFLGLEYAIKNSSQIH